MPIVVEGIDAPQLGRSVAEWVRAATIDIAERALREEVARGFDAQPVVITDGMPRRDYREVRPFGRIEFAARSNMAEVVLFALNELRKASPVRSGRYVSSHAVLLNGSEIEGNLALALRAVTPSDRVQIVNPQPYARKLEGATANRSSGRGKRRPSSRQAPNGIYRVVQRRVIARYGKTLFVDFKYVTLNLGVKVWARRGGRRVQRDQVYPALQFFIKADG